MPSPAGSAETSATAAGSRSRAGVRSGRPSTPARPPTGVAASSARRPAGRGGVVTTATSVTLDMRASASSTGTANAPEPKKTARTGSAAGGRLCPLRVDPALLEGRVGRLVLLVVHAASTHRDQLIRRREVVHVELPLQMIQLVLERQAEKAGARDLELLPDPVLGDHPDLLLPRDIGHVARDREAAFQVAVFAVAADDPRVYQLEEAILHLDHRDVQRFADLRGRETDARRIAHGLGQVVDQPVQELVEALHGLTAQPEPRVAEREDRKNAHGPSIREVPVSASVTPGSRPGAANRRPDRADRRRAWCASAVSSSGPDRPRRQAPAASSSGGA